MKKSISVMLVLSIIISLFAMCGVTSFAEEITSGKCGEDAVWEYDADSKTITVSGSGSLWGSSDWKNLDFLNFIVTDEISYIGSFVLGAEHTVEYIFIDGNVKCISDYAFSHCPNLKKIELGYGIESLEVGPFANNPALETVNIPGSVKTFMGCTFANCSSLKNVVLEEGVEEITNVMFFNCVSLKSLVLPETLKIIREEAFMGCTSLKEISVPVSTTRIYYKAFEGTSLEKITINNKNCIIDFDESTIPETAVIYGYTDSIAESYAKAFDRKFVALDDDLFSKFVRFFENFADLIKAFFNRLLSIFSIV